MLGSISADGILAVQPSENNSSRIASFVDVSSQSYLSQMWDNGRMTFTFHWAEEEKRTVLSTTKNNDERVPFRSVNKDGASIPIDGFSKDSSLASICARRHLCFSAFPSSSQSSLQFKKMEKSEELREANAHQGARMNELLHDSESDNEDEFLFSVPFKNGKKAQKKGSHVAVVYEIPKGRSANSSFFSAAVLRCDTWAVQWAVGPLILYPGSDGCCPAEAGSAPGGNAAFFTPTSHITLLHSGLLCGVAKLADDDCAMMVDSPALFVAAQPLFCRRSRYGRQRQRGKREFVASPFLFPFAEIEVVENRERGNSFAESGSSSLERLTILEREQRKHPKSVLTCLAVAPLNNHSLAILLASGGLYQLNVHQIDSSSLGSLAQQKKVRENEKGRLSSPVLDAAYPALPRDGTQDIEITVTAVYLGEVPRWVASSTSAALATFGLKALHYADDQESERTVLAVYEQRRQGCFHGLRKVQKNEEEEDVIYLLSFCSSKPQWTKMAVNKGFCVREVACFIPDAFPSTTSLVSSSSSDTATPLLLLHLQERTPPFADAVQGVLVVLSPMKAVDDLIPLPLLKLPSASLRLVGSYYNAEERAHVLICASNARSQFFHSVQSSLFQSTLKSINKGMPNNNQKFFDGEKDDHALWLEHPESWLVTKVFYEESLGGYSPYALQESDARNRNGGVWVPLLLPFSGRHKAVVLETSVRAEGNDAMGDEEEGEATLFRVQGTWKEGSTAIPVFRRHFPPIELTYPLTAFCNHPLEHTDHRDSSGLATPSLSTAHVAFFTVSVAPGTHTRLAKQWHNGVQGLHLLVTQALQQAHKMELMASPLAEASEKSTTEESELGSAFGRMPSAEDPLFFLFHYHWHSKYIRRVLKSLSATQLGLLLQSVCQWIFRASLAEAVRGAECEAVNKEKAKPRPVWYFQVATSAIPLALQIISLARQKGLTLTPFLLPFSSKYEEERRHTRCFHYKGEERSILLPLLEFLRGSRALGHPLRRLLPRMEMMVETGRQHRMLHALLATNKKLSSAPTPNKRGEGQDYREEGLDSSAEMNESDFYIMRSLLEGNSSSAQGGDAASTQKYIPNTWARQLGLQEEALSTMLREAQGYLKVVEEDLKKLAPEDGAINTEEALHVSSSPSSSWMIDWRNWGSRAHSDNFLRVFESGIMVQRD